MKKNVFVGLLVVVVIGGGFFLTDAIRQNQTLRDKNEQLVREVATLNQKQEDALIISAHSTPMEIQLVLEKIGMIAEKFPNRGMLATSGILFSLVGSLQLGDEYAVQLFETVTPLMNKRVEWIKSQQQKERFKQSS